MSGVKAAVFEYVRAGPSDSHAPLSCTVGNEGAYRPGEPGGDDPATEDEADDNPPMTDGEKCTFLTGNVVDGGKDVPLF